MKRAGRKTEERTIFSQWLAEGHAAVFSETRSPVSKDAGVTQPRQAEGLRCSGRKCTHLAPAASPVGGREDSSRTATCFPNCLVFPAEEAETTRGK